MVWERDGERGKWSVGRQGEKAAAIVAAALSLGLAYFLSGVCKLQSFFQLPPPRQQQQKEQGCGSSTSNSRGRGMR